MGCNQKNDDDDDNNNNNNNNNKSNYTLFIEGYRLTNLWSTKSNKLDVNIVNKHEHKSPLDYDIDPKAQPSRLNLRQPVVVVNNFILISYKDH